MKLRFLGLLAALGVGSAAVLVYASQSRPAATALSDCPVGGASACCATTAAPVVAQDDACCAAEAAPAAPVSASVDQK